MAATVTPIRMVDVATGALTDVAFPDGLPRQRGGRRLTDTWSLVFDTGWDALADAQITLTDLRVFFVLSRRAPITGGAWEIAGSTVAARLRINDRRVRTAVAHLVTAQLLLRPRRGYVEFNPDLFWRGSSKSRVERRNSDEES